MRNFRIFAAALMLAAIISVTASAQTRPATNTPARPAATQQATPPAANPNAPVPETKIAFINTEAFGADKGGITRYVNAVNALDREFKPRTDELTNMQNRIRTIAEDLGKLSSGTAVIDQKTIQAKREEGERLQRDLEYKDKQLRADMQKRYEEVVGPISQDIGKALDAFAAQRGITMLLDISKIAPAILTADRAMDVTAAFIADYNSKNTTASTGTR